MKYIYFLLFFFSVGVAFGQQADTTAKKVVTVNATGQVFMCPVLNPRFINQVQKKFNAKNIEVTNDKNTFTFITNHTTIDQDSIKLALTNSAIPLNIITEIKIENIPVAGSKK